MPFCRFCGKELMEGQECGCPGSVAAAQHAAQSAPAPQAAPVQSAPAQGMPVQGTPAQGMPVQGTPVQGMPVQGAPVQSAPSQSSVMLNQAQNVLGRVWKKLVAAWKMPYDGSVAYVRGASFTEALILMFAQAITAALFALVCIQKINGLIGLGGYYTESLKFSGASAFLLTVVYSMIFSALFALVCLGAMAIAKCGTDWRKAFVLASVRAIPLIPVNLLACVLMLVNPATGLAVFYVLGLLAEVVFLLVGMNGMNQMKRNQTVYFALAAVIIILIVMALLAQTILMSYVPSSITNMMSQSFSWEDVLSMM